MKNFMRQGWLTVLALVWCSSSAHADQAIAVGRVPVIGLAIPVPMPEPSSHVILAVDLLFVGALIFLYRRRATR